MARCTECNKWKGPDVDSMEGLDNPDIEVNNEEGKVVVDLELELPCEECGSTLLTLSGQAEGDFPDHAKGRCEPTSDSADDAEEHQFEVVDSEFTSTEEYIGKGPRKRRMIGAEGNIKLQCSRCETEVEVHVELSEAVSAWDEAG